jgi:predicted exporter/lauroyl/myristoyl acyltransferase
MSKDSLKHPGRWIWLLLLVPALFGLNRLRFNVEVLDLLPPELEPVQGLKLYQEYFANARELILTVEAPDSEIAERASRQIALSLRAHSNLVSSVTWQAPWLERPQDAAELIAYLWLNQPPAVFSELAERLAPANLPPLLAAARDQLASSMSPETIGRLSYDPFGLTQLPDRVASAAPAFGQEQDAFSSAEGKFRLLFIQAALELRTYRDCEEWLGQIRQWAREATAGESSGIQLAYTGRPAFVAEVARGMQHDMTLSVVGTAVIIAILFWLAHRRILPMLWLLVLLALVLGCTLAFAGLIFGSINVVSMGFAAILLGLAVDYAVVHYQEALAHPGLSIPQIRRAIAPSILWAAVTTIAAFLALNFGGLPGLAQLGTMVGVGVALAALIMVFEFLPPLFPGRNSPRPEQVQGTPEPQNLTGRAPLPGASLALVITVVVVVASLATLAFGLPGIDVSAKPLRPQHSEAYETLERIQSQMGSTADAFWLIVGGRDESEVARQLAELEIRLGQAAHDSLIASHRLPTPIWPVPENQAANRATAKALAQGEPMMTALAEQSGFATPALGLANAVLETWRRAADTTGVYWPTNHMSRWIFDKVTARTPTNWLALGVLEPTASLDKAVIEARLGELRRRLPRDGVLLSGWPLLGSSIFSEVKRNMWLVVSPMVCLVLLSLWFAFRDAAEILLSFFVLALSGLSLMAVMRLAGWSWNLLNLMAIPLILGTGVDYSLFMQLALRRHGGDLRVAYHSVGRALLLCGGTAIAGFGTLALSSNAGMASLGAVCAIGIAANMLLGVFLLPHWWTRFAARGRNVTSPSILYRGAIWRIGRALVRIVPRPLGVVVGSLLASLYRQLSPARRRIVAANLIPALDGNSRAVRITARNLFRNFVIKVIDLLRWEAGVSIEPQLGQTSGWHYFETARAGGRGVLLLTPHLGNWELGTAFLVRQGIKPKVVTLAEPGKHFTALRSAARARADIETLVIGSDPFAFVSIIKELENGATVALLVDRPSAATSVIVQLFGRPFPASVAPAELARACGCALVPVYLPWMGTHYTGHLLPPIAYDRAALRSREERVRLTQRIMQAFEPVILKHLDQWYHFVPVWPKKQKE